MAMKLLAHVFRTGIPALASTEPAGAATADSRRWVFRDLVVRRDGYAAWGLWSPARAGAAKPRREAASETLWPDTQPWCHE
jgi:hypothetical protein